MSNVPFLIGHTIVLRPPCDEDVTEDNWHHWYNDATITRFNSHGVFPISREKELQYVRTAMNRHDCLLMAIIEKNSGRLLGNAALQNIDFLNRRCNIALTIGEQTALSAGVETYGLLIQHAFCRLNLNRVADATHEKLLAFIHMLRVLGFTIEGQGRQHFLRDGQYYDSILFGVLASDFFRLREERGGSILFETHEDLLKAIFAAARQID